MKASVLKNKKIVSFLLFVVFGVVVAFSVMQVKPSKITDPNDPRFNSTEFRFDDYETLESFRAAALSICNRKGATVDDLDQAFLVSGKAKKSGGEMKMNGNVYFSFDYRYPHPDRRDQYPIGTRIVYGLAYENQEAIVDCEAGSYDKTLRLLRPK